jgi:murein DD-endopeptidase MepM/ murein hydrolase activator NlpD
LSSTGRTSPARVRHEPVIWWDIGPSFGGVYTTANLIDVQQRLERLGAPKRVLREVYAPFIVMGPSEFTDTWGSVRQHTRNRLRPHLGQDVFCNADAPVLAVEAGRVELVSDRLGGTVARLHHERGGYWYYAHLSGYPKGLASGDTVETGDVIGYCGTSGNAAGTAPHVHFGSYPGPGNPMGNLIEWLTTAEVEARRTLERFEAKPARRTPTRAVAEEPDKCPLGTRAAPATDTLELLLGG